MGPGVLQRESASEHSTLLGEEFPTARPNRPLPAPKLAGEGNQDSSITLSSLPFTRPPAKPIVDADAKSVENDVAQSSRWFQGLVSRLLRSNSDRQ